MRAVAFCWSRSEGCPAWAGRGYLQQLGRPGDVALLDVPHLDGWVDVHRVSFAKGTVGCVNQIWNHFKALQREP
jgi:hypothetical protein